VARYRLLIKRSAARELESLGLRDDRQRVVARINALAENPRPPGAEQLAGQEGRYRVRQGNYRILYEVRDADAIVTVVKIGDRKEVYR
jgi:mRNA interferase RelE/StbE